MYKKGTWYCPMAEHPGMKGAVCGKVEKKEKCQFVRCDYTPKNGMKVIVHQQGRKNGPHPDVKPFANGDQHECRANKDSGKWNCDCRCSTTIKPTEILHYTFDSAHRRFYNKLFNPTAVNNVKIGMPKYWTINFWRRYYYLNIETIGRCELAKYNGNMAWHVVNNNAHSMTRSDECKLYTKSPVIIPERFAECMFSLLIRDVDHNGQTKESNDFVCFSVTDAAGKQVAGTKKCQKNDVRRLEASWWRRYSDRWYEGTIGYRQVHDATILESKYIPAHKFKGGFKVQIWAKSDHQYEHWYADDLKVTCKGGQ